MSETTDPRLQHERGRHTIARKVIVVEDGGQVRAWIGTNVNEGQLRRALNKLGIRARVEQRSDPCRMHGGAGYWCFIEGASVNETLTALSQL